MTKKAVLLVNLGSPDSTEIKDVKKYLGEFLMDKRVIDAPFLLRWLIVKGIILQFRPKKSAEAYKSIWWEEGSPLIVLTKRLLSGVQALQPDIAIAMGMRYGNPSIKAGIEELISKTDDLKKILLVPLYPHYAMSSYESVVVKAEEVIQDSFPNIELEVVAPFYNDKAYNEALCRSIKDNIPQEYDKILFSYHGIPERHLRKTDPTHVHCLSTGDCCQTDSEAHERCYRHQVFVTTKQMVDKLGLPPDKYITTFQSRLGSDKWLTPYTADTLVKLPGKGIKKLVVVCPAFVSDCLETIEEIGAEGKESFLESGGEEFTLIPCLNDRQDWVEVLSGWINEFKSEPVEVK